MSALIMIVSAVSIIALVKFGLLRGIDNIANAMNWSAKARGQFIGYARNLTGTNVANVGIAYPMGLLAFLLESFFSG